MGDLNDVFPNQEEMRYFTSQCSFQPYQFLWSNCISHLLPCYLYPFWYNVPFLFLWCEKVQLGVLTPSHALHFPPPRPQKSWRSGGNTIEVSSSWKYKNKISCKCSRLQFHTSFIYMIQQNHLTTQKYLTFEIGKLLH